MENLSFNDWAQRACKLNYSSTREYIESGRFASDFPAAVAAGKLQSNKAGVLLERARQRKPEAMAAILADIPAGPAATIPVVEAAILKHGAEKPEPTAPTERSTSNRTTAMEKALRDSLTAALSRHLGKLDVAIIADAQDCIVEVVAAVLATESAKRNAGLVPQVLANLMAEWNGNLQTAREAAEKRAEARQAREATRAAA